MELQEAELLGHCVKYYVDANLNEAGRLWPVAQALAAALAVEHPPPGALERCTLLELGAGTGALACACGRAYPSANVWATDLEEVMPLIARNLEANAVTNVRPLALPWGSPLPEPLATHPPAVVLACEVLYWGGWSLLTDDTREPLRKTLQALCGPETQIYVGLTVRDAPRELGFLRALRDAFCIRNLLGPAPQTVAEGVVQDPLDHASEGDVLLLVLTRRRMT